MVVLVDVTNMLVRTKVTKGVDRGTTTNSSECIFRIIVKLTIVVVLCLLSCAMLTEFSGVVTIILLFTNLIALLNNYRLGKTECFVMLPKKEKVSVRALVLFCIPVCKTVLCGCRK